jgi:hypothetical protein
MASLIITSPRLSEGFNCLNTLIILGLLKVDLPDPAGAEANKGFFLHENGACDRRNLPPVKI